jgi:two-component system heavy metal sensor histidine kinase CusS
MKSVRLSLVVYFALLLGGALGAVSLLAYRQAAASLQERQKSLEQMLQAKYEERQRLENEQLDAALLADARNLASLVQVQIKVPRLREPVWCGLGLLTASLCPSAYYVCPVWVAESVPGPVSFHLRAIDLTPQLHRFLLPADPEGQVARYFQLNLPNGSEWRSPSLEHYAFAFHPERFASSRLIDWEFDDTEMPPGQPVRRVTLRLSRFRVFFDWSAWHGPKPPPGSRKDPPPGPPPKPPPGPPGRMPPEWTLYIQAAAPTRLRDEALARFRQELAAEQAAAAAESAAALRTLKGQLLAIGLITFAAALLGGLALVGVGLRPLQRLSEAVSRVSPRDFRLPLDPASLPEELRPIAQRLAQTLEQLRRAFAREKQAAADISHELRTPLAALMASLDVALRKPRSAEEYHRVLEECRATGQQMGELVERLLALARLDAGAAQLRLRSVDLIELVEQCLALVRPLAESRGLHLEAHCPPSLPLVTDPDKLREILTNLLHNAIEYNRPQGRVEVRVETAGSAVCLAVRDTGVGIPEAVLPHIFERFYRADPARQAEGLHAGIGLAIVKGYVELLGGHVEVSSQVGVGSTFTVRLPVRPPVSQAP